MTSTSIGELFPKCRKLAYDARQQVAQQGLVANGAPAFQQHHHSLDYLEELNRQLDCMDELALRETPRQRVVWKRKIDELRQEAISLQQQAKQQQTTSIYQSQRNDLLRRRRGRQQESDLQLLSQESDSLQQSEFMLNDLIGQGESSLNSLVEQRKAMSGVFGRVADISNRLGLTQSTMRIIERRDITDAYLVFAGMVVTCIVIYFVWF